MLWIKMHSFTNVKYIHKASPELKKSASLGVFEAKANAVPEFFVL
jgi:hypothetical protein